MTVYIITLTVYWLSILKPENISLRLGEGVAAEGDRLPFSNGYIVWNVRHVLEFRRS